MPIIRTRRKSEDGWPTGILPPDELENLLNIYKRVAHKTLRISKVFGIEGKKLLRPEDNFEALKEFNETYEGSTTALEELHLEFRQLLKDHPELKNNTNGFPSRVFSGKEHPKKGSRAVFFCYALPAPGAKNKEGSIEDASLWTEEAGFTKWFLFDFATEKICRTNRNYRFDPLGSGNPSATFH